jgi:hypothetical protein
MILIFIYVIWLYIYVFYVCINVIGLQIYGDNILKMYIYLFINYIYIGTYIVGLSLEGASWSTAQGGLESSKPREMFCPLPVINIRPAVVDKLEQVRTSSHMHNYDLCIHVYLYLFILARDGRDAFENILLYLISSHYSGCNLHVSCI